MPEHNAQSEIPVWGALRRLANALDEFGVPKGIGGKLRQAKEAIQHLDDCAVCQIHAHGDLVGLVEALNFANVSGPLGEAHAEATLFLSTWEWPVGFGHLLLHLEDASPSFGVVMLLERARAELNIIDRAIDCLSVKSESPGVPMTPFQMRAIPPEMLEQMKQKMAEVKSTKYEACNCGTDCYQKDDEDQPCWGRAIIRDADHLRTGEHRCDGHRDSGTYHHLPQAH